MMPNRDGPRLQTTRLRLEPFSQAHAAALNILDSDPAVMRFIGDGSTRTLDQTKAAIGRVQERWERLGYAWWTLFERQTGDAIGAACLQHLANEEGAPLEIGWRLRPDKQGKGYATEAGRAILRFAFRKVGADEVLAVAHPDNVSSRKVMERLGMTDEGIETHYGQPCIVYRIERPANIQDYVLPVPGRPSRGTQ
jgi:RimJ/RimL family protein N-acetyltransferase